MQSVLVLHLLTEPERVEVFDPSQNWLATVTAGARTVTLNGPERIFAEAAVTVTHAVWVRCLPEPYSGELDLNWLQQALDANSQLLPDLLELATQYVKGKPPVLENGIQIAGDAGYGPLIDGKRQEGSDFNDYLGVSWPYPDEPWSPDQPEAAQFQCLDCSGFVRMLGCFRRHAPNSGQLGVFPVSYSVKPGHVPLRAFQMAVDGPGVVVIPNTGVQVTDLAKLAIGDLVFFKADNDDINAVDHVGIYMGKDSQQNFRFVSAARVRTVPRLPIHRDSRSRS